MLQHSEIIKNPKAIEELICVPLMKHRNERVLEKHEMEMFFTLLMCDNQKIDSIYKDICNMSIVPKVLETRQAYIFKNNLLDYKCIIAITTITQGNIGKAIMYLYFLQWWAFENNVDPLNFAFEIEFCQIIFPNGVFLDKSMSDIWDDTKVGGEDSHTQNLIDYAYCADSFIRKNALRFSDLSVGDIVECQSGGNYMGEEEVTEIGEDYFNYDSDGEDVIVTDLDGYVMIEKSIED